MLNAVVSLLLPQLQRVMASSFKRFETVMISVISPWMLYILLQFMHQFHMYE
jgi:hypothetical protein